jgi:uncharacterized protein (DUF736 family)
MNINAFKNRFKETENHPDYKGYCENTDKQIAIWVKKDKNNQTYLSCSISDKISSETRSNGMHQSYIT